MPSAGISSDQYFLVCSAVMGLRVILFEQGEIDAYIHVLP